ncbi:MAG: hypothetical protein AUH13_14410 [Acidobacteria bacterium 13_2_20CM_58_27]|nr:MAG: hypothetical protein AUH13_14410 [Acidobacteria bacterium 13_2_20CM_58_27]
MAAPKPFASSETEAPREFFKKQLAGEVPVSFPTAKRLFEKAAELMAIRPWQFLEDQDLILLKSPLSDETCYCSVMGALGQVFSLHAYVGGESYLYFRKMAAGEPISIGEFYGSLRGVYVEFVGLSQLTPPDRELARVFGHPLKRGLKAPIFRAMRPGYQPWYLTEDEGNVLAECLEAVIALCESIARNGAPDYWNQPDVYPFLAPTQRGQERLGYDIEMRKITAPLATTPAPARLDQNRIEQIRRRNYPIRGAFEAEHFYAGGTVGKRDERKAIVRLALVADADSGLVFPPEAGMPERATSEMLATAVLSAIETARFLPREVRISHLQWEACLESLARELGFAVRMVKRLPAAEEAKESLLAAMGDPGPLIA